MTYKLKGKTYITSKEQIKINDWVTNGYDVFQWDGKRTLTEEVKIIKTNDKNLESVTKLTNEEVNNIWINHA